MLLISLTSSSTVSSGATSVELTIPLCVAAPPGEIGAIAATASAPSSSVFSSGTHHDRHGRRHTVSLAVESTPAFSSAGGTIGVIDIKENAAGALYDTNGSAVLDLTLPPGFTWNTSDWATTSPFTYMWGGASALIRALLHCTGLRQRLLFPDHRPRHERRLYVRLVNKQRRQGTGFLQLDRSLCKRPVD